MSTISFTYFNLKFILKFISFLNLRIWKILLSENPSLFLCTLFPGCKYVWNFENQSAEKYNFEFMSLHQPSFDSLRWNGAQLGSLGKELNMNLLSTLPFPIQCFQYNTSSIFRVNLVFAPFYMNYFNFCDRNVIHCLAMDMFCTILENISFHYTYADDLLMLMLIF